MREGKEESAATAAAGEAGMACDFYGSTAARAVFYCRANSTALCLACYHQVHAANLVSSKHLRSPLCDSYLAAAVAIYCGAYRRFLCANCNFDA